jgi:hypothetical protein
MIPEMYWDASRVLTHLNVDNKVNFRYPDDSLENATDDGTEKLKKGGFKF